MTVSVSEKSRQSLRLNPEIWEKIDCERRKRAGSVSRNTWIAEAILEKLSRDQDLQKPGTTSNA
jgi:metal-responsive CopG/Arc/MetJ family transcriptional regulator